MLHGCCIKKAFLECYMDVALKRLLFNVDRCCMKEFLFNVAWMLH